MINKMKKLIHYLVTESKYCINKTGFTSICLIVISLNAFGNNLTITNVGYSQTNNTVTFDLSWQNSWRKSDWTAKNWDATWIFVKWRLCSDPATTAFTHGLVSTVLGDHSYIGSTALEPTMKDGTVGIDPSPNNTGVMLRRATDLTTGAVTASITLKLTNLAATTGNTIDLRVFGIEMVFVPQNAFMIGDGNGNSQSSSAFNLNGSSSPYIYPMPITSENATPMYDPLNCNGCIIVATFPKGFNSFYIMKYEISQGQYADFLNAGNTSVQTNHYPNKSTDRHTIANTGVYPQQYFASRPDRACNWLTWSDASTYLDWAALRPLTELEYEKACRGTDTPVLNQKAWGTNTGTRATTITCASCSPAENGTETVQSGANVNTATSTNFSGGDAGQGPMRCGIFATSNTTSRLQTGMSYYGVMEMSGNVSEYYILTYSGYNGPSSTASGVNLGNGNLTSGNHDETTWPTATFINQGPYYIIRRGGSWSSGSGASNSNVETNISYRGNTTVTADNTSGARGGR
jgi:formylglycine-generating enzyme required for sulfatase activity